jgi:hypothetical protein
LEERRGNEAHEPLPAKASCLAAPSERCKPRGEAARKNAKAKDAGRPLRRADGGTGSAARASYASQRGSAGTQYGFPDPIFSRRRCRPFFAIQNATRGCSGVAPAVACHPDARVLEPWQRLRLDRGRSLSSARVYCFLVRQLLMRARWTARASLKGPRRHSAGDATIRSVFALNA